MNKSVATFFYYCVIVGRFLKNSFEDPSVEKVLDHSWTTGAQMAGHWYERKWDVEKITDSDWLHDVNVCVIK